MNAKINRVMRRAGALALAAVLLILIAPASRADTAYSVTHDVEAFCVPFGQAVFALQIPDIDFGFATRSTLELVAPNPTLIERVPGIASFSGRFYDPTLGVAFDVELSMSGLDGCVVPPITATNCEEDDHILNYRCFSNASGTMTGVSFAPSSGGGTADNTFLGAAYSLSLKPGSVFIFGNGASIFHPEEGFRGEFIAQLTVPNENPLSTDPMDAEIRFTFEAAAAVIPVADASVHGTWTGTLDCIGQSGVNTPIELSNTSTPTTLQIQSGGATLGADNYCVNIPATPGGAEGQLADPGASPTSSKPRGYVKYDGTTLKLRLMRSEGTLQDISFCKGEFTQTSTQTNFTVDWGCGGIQDVAPDGCTTSSWAKDTDGDGLDDTFLSCSEARNEWCDTIVCGPGRICTGGESIRVLGGDVLCSADLN